MISKNVTTCIKAVRLSRTQKEAFEMMKDCTPGDLQEAGRILQNQALIAAKALEIGARHQARSDESFGDVLTKAAKAGDEDAKLLIACGLLDQKVY